MQTWRYTWLIEYWQSLGWIYSSWSLRAICFVPEAWEQDPLTQWEQVRHGRQSRAWSLSAEAIRFQKRPRITEITDQNLTRSGGSYSHYYSGNTLKYSVAIAPCRLVKFISLACRGRCSDMSITQESGFFYSTFLLATMWWETEALPSEMCLFERRANLVTPAYIHLKVKCHKEDASVTRFGIVHIQYMLKEL